MCRPTRTRRTAEPQNRVRLERVSEGGGAVVRWMTTQTKMGSTKASFFSFIFLTL